MKSLFISFLTAITFIFSFSAFASPLSSEDITLESIKVLENDAGNQSATLHLSLKNDGEKKHYLMAAYTPVAEQARLYRVDKETEKQRLTRRAEIPQNGEERTYDLLIKLTGLTEGLDKQEMLLIFADGSAQSIKLS